MIVAVAILLDGTVYTLPPPARHHTLRAILPGGYIPSKGQGFIDDLGTFYERGEAEEHARRVGSSRCRSSGAH